MASGSENTLENSTRLFWSNSFRRLLSGREDEATDDPKESSTISSSSLVSEGSAAAGGSVIFVVTFRQITKIADIFAGDDAVQYVPNFGT